MAAAASTARPATKPGLLGAGRRDVPERTWWVCSRWAAAGTAAAGRKPGSLGRLEWVEVGEIVSSWKAWGSGELNMDNTYKPGYIMAPILVVSVVERVTLPVLIRKKVSSTCALIFASCFC